MDISLSGLWASPSTLHLRLVVRGRENRWVRFYNLHIPMEEIPAVVVNSIVAAHASVVDGLEAEADPGQPPLFVVEP